ncbi:MAG: SOS response-associated peptidase family protein, partial [Pseudomonadota bacterium]
KKRDQGAKQPYRIYLYDGLFAFAGLWERWAGPSGDVLSCTILTTAANLVVRNIHDRMPSILEPKDYARWLDPATHDAALRVMAKRTYPNKKTRFCRVSTAVNAVRNDGPECVAELPPDDLLLGY